MDTPTQDQNTEWRARLLASLQNDSGVPDHLWDGLLDYIVLHEAPGSFLSAVLSNDLRRSFERADSRSSAALASIVSWVYSMAPAKCWGSPSRFDEWCEGPR
jgi:hypothetical protein